MSVFFEVAPFDPPPSVLLVGPESACAELESLLSTVDCQPLRVNSCAGALEALREQPIPVVITETELPDGSWRKLLAQFRDLEDPPNLVVTSSDGSMLAEVLLTGAFDLLEKPAQPDCLSRMLKVGCVRWSRRKESRIARQRGAARRLAAGFSFQEWEDDQSN